MMHDDAYVIWETTQLGSEESEALYDTLLREVSAADKNLWASLARLKYRHTIIHL